MKMIEQPWLEISNDEVVPMWYYGRNTLEIPREVGVFWPLRGLIEVIGSDYSRKQRNTSTAIMKESLGMRLYDDHSPNFDNTHRIQLSAHCPFVIQINYLHAFKETLTLATKLNWK